MNFDLDEDQRLLKSSVERFATDRYGGDVERRRSYCATEHGFSPENWSMLADMGLTALPFSEADGGLGGGLPELMVAGEAFGEGLVVEPWLESIVLAGGAFAHLAGAAQREELLPSIIAGDRRLALAWAEPGSRYRHDAPGMELKDGRLKGRKTFVPAGGGAGVYIATATHNGNFAAALVEADADGLHARPYRLADGGVACELELNDVPAKHLDGADDALAAFEDALTPVRVAATAEMVGLAALLHRTTLDYAKQREQFGRPIGSFQALQHRMVDGYRDLEQARSQLYRAALTGTADAAIGAKAFVSEAATRIGHSAVQIHGGMGMTDELAVGHALKRIMVLAKLFGDAPMERARLREAA